MRRKVKKCGISIYPQCDKVCTNTNRLFLGTNKEVVLHSKNARVTAEQILAIPCDPSSTDGQSSKVRVSQEIRSDPELDAQIRSFDFLSYLAERNGEYSGNGNIISFQNCEVCGHKDDLRYYRDTNTFYCFSSSGEVGGTIIHYLMAVEGLTVGQAIDKFSHELCQPEWHEPELLQEQKLPTFPVRQLPSGLREYVTAVSKNTATAVDMPALAALALIAAAVQGKFYIEGKPGYEEQLNLFFLIIAKSGERKIRRAQKQYYQDYDQSNLPV